jgi:hypothetical protein
MKVKVRDVSTYKPGRDNNMIMHILELIINPFWAILIGAVLTWIYFRQQNVLTLYKAFYTELIDARSVVDTWSIYKTYEEFNKLYRELADSDITEEKREKDKENYYKTLQLAMFMQHLAAMHEKKFTKKYHSWLSRISSQKRLNLI